MDSEKFSDLLKTEISNQLIFPAYIWPCIGYFNSIQDGTCINVPVCNKFIKQSEYTRYKILTSQGVKNMIIPVKAGKTTLPVNEVKISYDFDWRRQHWKTLQSAYGSAPYYDHFSPMIKEIYQCEFEFLYQFNLHVLQNILMWLNKKVVINTIFHKSDLAPDIFRINLKNEVNPYIQVFANRYSFIDEVSILDKILNAGF